MKETTNIGREARRTFILRVPIVPKPFENFKTSAHPAGNSPRLRPRDTAPVPLPHDRRAFERDAHGNMATKPEHHLGFQDRGNARALEQVDPTLFTVKGFLLGIYGWDEPALTVQIRHDERHAETAPLLAECCRQPFGIEIDEHEMKAFGLAAFQYGQ